ncbi:DUF255 domain-containing protein [Niastella caeni]|uniref:DUF255 domain-containing protein n=1 Tax=Niastella caeni TaxID=2569763 RepID=A0A4S8HD13_9BACT|nr:thioredoxin family protein [Niastella caeni]THU32918.1 DUF255 domain-containing protein [Niastella caeni]
MAQRFLIWLIIFGWLLVCPAFNFAQTISNDGNEGLSFNGIRWTIADSWDKVIEKASKDNKFIFVDCYATWCGPCKKMDKEVLIKENVVNLMNNKFICLKLQLDKTSKDDENVKKWYLESERLSKQYQIISFPTYLFFSPKGKLVHRGTGFNAEASFLSLAKAALNPEHQFYTLIEDYKKGKINYDAIPYLLTVAQKSGNRVLVESLKGDYNKHLNSLPKEKLYTISNIEYLNANLKSTGSPFFQLFYPDGKKVNEIMKQSGYARRTVDSVISREFIYPVLRFTPENKEPDWNMMSRTIAQKFGKSYAERTILWAKAKRVDRELYRNDFLFLKYFLQLVKIGGFDTSFYRSDVWLNVVAFEKIFKKSNDYFQIDAAIKWMSGVVRRNPTESYYIDTYIRLLYKAGRKEEAVLTLKQYENYAIKTKNSGMLSLTKNLITAIDDDKPIWPPTDFSGIWILKDIRKLNGYEISDAILADLISISQDGTSKLKIERKMKKNNQIVTTTEEFLEDKSVEEFTALKRRKVSQIKWASDLKSLVQRSVYFEPDSNNEEYTTNDEWHLEQNGTVLLIYRTRTFKSGVIKKWVSTYYKL